MKCLWLGRALSSTGTALSGIILLSLVLFIAKPVFAATVSGAVYDLNLRQVTTAVVTVNTAQEQRMVTHGDGAYLFRLPPGNYTLLAKAAIDGTDMRATENITISDDGAYVIDLILSPDLDTNLTLGADPPPPFTRQEPAMPLYAVGVLVILGVLLTGFLILRRRRPGQADGDEYRTAVLDVLKSNDGRATQHDIRRAVGFSEAKVSLVITELESEGRVKKVKRGRGNIIMLR